MNFPMFFDLHGRKVVVVGGGNIAQRRIAVLLEFGAEVTIIAPEVSAVPEGAAWTRRPYETGDLEGAFFAVAATNNRQVNHQVGVDAGLLRIPVSVADCLQECTFFFPAICRGENLVAGVVSDGTHHHETARAARAIRKTLEELE